jgi:hypothetical protein
VLASVVVYQIREHHRSKIICDAMLAGIRAVGDRVVVRDEQTYRQPEGNVAVFYGLEGKLPSIFEAYKREGRRAVYVDLGYWGRREGGRWAGYHKVSVNARHPNAYFQRTAHCHSRIERFGVKANAWRDGHHILLAGMGDKGAPAEGFAPEQWEREAIRQIRMFSSRPIIYRPKPSWKKAQPIDGVGFSPKEQKVEQVLAGAHCVVTHHSNVAIDGIVEGIGALTWGGLALPMASSEFADVDHPPRRAGREQWMADIAWTQWSVEEMKQGLPWRHLKAEGLIP